MSSAVIVVGAGIAGIVCAIELLDRYAPEAKSVLPKPLSREYKQPAKLKLYRV